MLEVQDDIKSRIKKTGHKSSELSRKLDMNYDSLNAYLNGRRKMPEGLLEKIEKQLKVWESGL